MTKNRFESEEAANAYKREHQLNQRVAEPIGGGKWGLVFPIEAHITVKDGAPDGLREDQHYIELVVTLRSKATFGIDKKTIRVWDDQSAKDVAERIAHGYGAEVVEICNPDDSIYEEARKVNSAMTSISDFAWVGDAESAVAFGPAGLKVAIRTGNEVCTFDEVQKRLQDGEMGDDLPCVMERFGVDYDAACDAVFGRKFQEAISLMNQVRQKRPEAEKDDSLPKESPGM